ncbi:hypothetical protein C0992_011327, partial [Termitomyces sp. T32_za158]
MVNVWKMPNYLISELGKFQNPVEIALCVLRVLENDNIIVIHLDETQAVSSENLETLVKLLVKRMGYYFHEQVPWIFPILSGLSLETLLDIAQVGGAQVERYTPPILSITSMLNITRDLFYTGDHNGKQLEQPVFQPGYIRLLHDLRGPTRLFQAALLIIHDFSSPKVVAHQWSLQSPINREAIRAGLEKPNQDWNAIFDCVASLSQDQPFIKGIGELQIDQQLLKRLFDLNLLGETVWVVEKFSIKGKREPLSTLIDYGWATIEGTANQNRCTVFLPFLTLYGAVPNGPCWKYHPGLTPLCKTMDWKTIETEDARMLQYRLARRSMSDLLDTCLSDLFGQLGDVAETQFRLHETPCEFRMLQYKLETHDALSELWLSQPTQTV